MTIRSVDGQMTIEMTLLMIVFLSVTLAIFKTANAQGWAKSMVSGPWLPLQGMIEDGVWQPAPDSKAQNPSMKSRHGSNRGAEGDDSSVE